MASSTSFLVERHHLQPESMEWVCFRWVGVQFEANQQDFPPKQTAALLLRIFRHQRKLLGPQYSHIETYSQHPPGREEQWSGSLYNCSIWSLRLEDTVYACRPGHQQFGKKFHLFSKRAATSFHCSGVLGHDKTSSRYSCAIASQVSGTTLEIVLWATRKLYWRLL